MILLILSKAVIKKGQREGEGEKKRGEEETEGRILKAEGEMDMEEEETKSPQLYLWVNAFGHYYIMWHFLHDGPQNTFLIEICTSWLIFLLWTLACFYYGL